MRHVISCNGAVMAVTDETVLISGPDDTSTAEMLDDPADNTRLSVMGLLDMLEHEGDADGGPDADMLESLGLDPTGRTHIHVTWEGLARYLFELVHEEQRLIAKLVERNQHLDQALGRVAGQLSLINEELANRNLPE